MMGDVYDRLLWPDSQCIVEVLPFCIVRGAGFVNEEDGLFGQGACIWQRFLFCHAQRKKQGAQVKLDAERPMYPQLVPHGDPVKPLPDLPEYISLFRKIFSTAFGRCQIPMLLHAYIPCATASAGFPKRTFSPWMDT